MADNKKVIVTGGAGFIGSNIAKNLVKSGFEVHIIDNLFLGKKENIPENAIFHEVDIRDKQKIKEIFSEVGDIYCLFHCAAIPMVQYSIDNPAETHDVNINGTMNLLLAARDAKVRRVVYSASCSAYGDQDALPFVETMLPNPLSPYALQKYFGELSCVMMNVVYGLPTVSLRYFNVYGPGQDPNSTYAMVIAKFITLSQKGEAMTLTGDGSQTRDFIFIDDVVSANILAMEKENLGNGEYINIGSGVDVSIRQIAEIIGGEIEYIPARLEPKNTRADISKAKEILGFIPTVSIEEGIKIIKKSGK